MGRKRIYFAADGRLLGLLVEPLERAGLSVVTFETQAGLVSRATNDPPDALLIKARLIDGTALDAFRALPADGRPPTIVILAKTQGAQRPTLLKVGIHDVAISPIHPRELADRTVEAAGGFKRGNRRIAASLAVAVGFERRTIRGVTDDVSRAGLGLSLRGDLPAKAVVAIRLIGRARTLEVYGRVLRSEGAADRRKIGVRLIGLSDAEETVLMSMASGQEDLLVAPVAAAPPTANAASADAPARRSLSATADPRAPGSPLARPGVPQSPARPGRRVSGNGRFLDGSFDLPSIAPRSPPTASAPPSRRALVAPVLPASPRAATAPLEWHDVDLNGPATIPPKSSSARIDSIPPDWPKGSAVPALGGAPVRAPVHLDDAIPPPPPSATAAAPTPATLSEPPPAEPEPGLQESASAHVPADLERGADEPVRSAVEPASAEDPIQAKPAPPVSSAARREPALVAGLLPQDPPDPVSALAAQTHSELQSGDLAIVLADIVLELPSEGSPVASAPLGNAPAESPAIESSPVERAAIESPRSETAALESPAVVSPLVGSAPVETRSMEGTTVERPPIENPSPEPVPIASPPVESPEARSPLIEATPVETSDDTPRSRERPALLPTFADALEALQSSRAVLVEWFPDLGLAAREQAVELAELLTDRNALQTAALRHLATISDVEWLALDPASTWGGTNPDAGTLADPLRAGVVLRFLGAEPAVSAEAPEAPPFRPAASDILEAFHQCVGTDAGAPPSCLQDSPRLTINS